MFNLRSRFVVNRYASTVVLGAALSVVTLPFVALAWHAADPDGSLLQETDKSRFRTAPNFRVEQVIEGDEIGSLISMAFDESGRLLASQENGPLLRIEDADQNGVVETSSVFCDQVKNCQGILPLAGKIYVTADGPDGAGMYRLADANGDGKVDEIERLIEFTGPMAEHGAHSLTLGPDGLIYMIVGNLGGLKATIEETSPYHDGYPGDLVQPRHEDPGGHARGVSGPGGMIVRTDPSGQMIETFASGFRNPYDMAFNRQGDLLTHDADMESDVALPWHRPTRVLHVAAGGEYGWRSGWAKWPDYYLDSLPPLLGTGGGSPAGMVVYDHVMYPSSLHGALFVCDWANGRVLVVRTEPNGGSYKAQAEVFVEGHPLNATDVAVGPDGLVYFCTGGRGTEGGVYRIVWNGVVPPSATNFGTGITAAIRQPQLESAWARNRVAVVRQQLGDQWDIKLMAVAQYAKARPESRVRALDLMQLFGPPPSKALLSMLCGDAQPTVRAKAAYLMGIHGDASSVATLGKLIGDSDRAVARTALESLARLGDMPSFSDVAPALASADRSVRFAAGRLLERIDANQWAEAALSAPDRRVFNQGTAALLTIDPSRDTALKVIEQCSGRLPTAMPDGDLTDMLRVAQLALLRAELKREDAPNLGPKLAALYPAKSDAVNRELVRLLVHLQETSVKDRMAAELQSNRPWSERIHLAMHLTRLDAEWTTLQKNGLLVFMEQARKIDGGRNIGRYLERSSMEFGARLTADERLLVLKNGAKWPTAALAALVASPDSLDAETIAAMIQLDGQPGAEKSEAVERLRIAIVAVLSRSGGEAEMAFLREIFENQPERRGAVAMGLAQQPDGENWPLLIRALPILDAVGAQEVLGRLAAVDRIETDPEAIRQVILRGLLLGDNGGRRAIALLEKWTNQQASESDEPVAAALEKWQIWFAQRFPNHPPAVPPADSTANRWTYDELLIYLTNGEGVHGDPARGRQAFATSQCVKCHAYRGEGEAIGPDLTAVSRRFQKKEILQSILFPSHVISDQYAAKKVLTVDGQTFSGIVANDPSGAVTVLTSQGEKIALAEDEIDEIAPSSISAMPEGLLNDLTIEQIADLFAFLDQQSKTEVAGQPDESLKK